MSKLKKKLDFNEAISLTGYNEDLKKNLSSFLLNNYSNQKNKLYIFCRKKDFPKLLLLKLLISSKFKNNIYDISILIYFPKNFPLIPPDIFFHKYCNVKINPKCVNYIDKESLKINYSIFYKWENNFQSFKNLINVLHKEFNNNFPIFTLGGNINESENNFDCVINPKFCEEIEFINPSKKIIFSIEKENNNKKILRTETYNPNKAKGLIMQDKDKAINNKNIINEDKEKAAYHRAKTNNINKNINIYMDDITNNKKDNLIKNKIKTDYSNNKNDIKINKKPEPQLQKYDEKISKDCLIKLLLLELNPKIKKINESVADTSNNLISIKKGITQELNDYKSKEKQIHVLEKSIKLFKQKINQYNNSSCFMNDNKPDFLNLDNFLIINHKAYYQLQAKEKSIEEYILVIKKYFQKKKIDLKTALKLVRENSLKIFNIQYKYNTLNSNNI